MFETITADTRIIWNMRDSEFKLGYTAFATLYPQSTEMKN